MQIVVESIQRLRMRLSLSLPTRHGTAIAFKLDLPPYYYAVEILTACSIVIRRTPLSNRSINIS